MTRFRADLLLLLVALIWGTAFVAQKDANAHIGPFTFVALRYLLAALLLLPLARKEAKKKHTLKMKKRSKVLACGIGVALVIAATMQQVGLQTTTITNGGFLTAVYVAFVPFINWALTKKPPRPPILLACGITVIGAWLLTGGNRLDSIGKGDVIVFLADIAWATHITLISKFLASNDRPFFLSFLQYLIVGIIALIPALVLEPISLSALYDVLPAILYAGIMSSGVAYTLQIVAQRHTPPAEASIIMSLESVFAALSGVMFFHDQISRIAIAGCLLIICGVLLIELSPLWKKMRRVI